MQARLIGVTTAAAGLSLAATACGSSGTPATTPSPAHTAAAAGSRASVPAGISGAGCAKVPASGKGSFRAMASEPVATAAAHNPLLSDLMHAVRVAGLTGMLNSAKAITVFAPDNGAFAALGSGNVSTLLASKADLRKVLEYQVVKGRKTPADLASGATMTTLLGTSVHVVKSGSVYWVNNANIVCGNVHTANATVYIINRVLIP
jgi:uncharacterized surface protein with fasciclin (FAS1) repeats